MNYIKTFIIFIFLGFSQIAVAEILYSQEITLEPDWNIVSTPKILESFTFSAEDSSDNFEIYVLNPNSPSGWSTMADLGQTKFIPLYGYFIRNKTGINQTLTLNYKNTDLPENFFERIFSTTGWYSIGVANPSYVLPINADPEAVTFNNNTLSSLEGYYSSVIDFTDAQFSQNRKSVALTNPWKSVSASDINNLRGFRETKGYVIYITTPNSPYNGWQDSTIPSAISSDDIKLVLSLGSNNPDSQTIQVSEFSSTSNITLLEFQLKAEGVNMNIEQIGVDIESTLSNLNDIFDDVKLMKGNSTIADISSFDDVNSETITFDLYDDLIIEEGESAVLKVVAKIKSQSENFANGSTVKVDIGDISAKYGYDNEQVVNFEGSANGSTHTLFVDGAIIEFVSSTSVATNQDNTSRDFTLVFDVTAIGDDLTVNRTSFASTGVEYHVVGDGSATSAALSSNASLSSNIYTVYEGQTRRFTLTVNVTTATTGLNKIVLDAVSGIAPNTVIQSVSATVNQ